MTKRKKTLILLFLDSTLAWSQQREIARRRRMSSMHRAGSLTARRMRAARRWEQDQPP